MRDLFLPAAAVIIALAAWGAVDLARRIERGYRRLGRPMPAAEMDAMIEATSEPKPHPELAAPAPRPLCSEERYYAANLGQWLACQPGKHVIAAHGRHLADYLRAAIPDAPDVEIGRLVCAMLRATRQYRDLDDPFTKLCDAMCAAFLDLTALERSTTP